MKVNRLNSTYIEPAFKAKIDGRVALDICQEMYSRNLGKYSSAYVSHYEKLKASGLPSSEIYTSKGANGVTNFNFKNPEITTAYEIQLGSAKPGHLLETWFGIKPENIKNAEKKLKELISEKVNGLMKAAIERDDVYDKVLSAGGEKTLSDSIKKLNDDQIIDLYFDSVKNAK